MQNLTRSARAALLLVFPLLPLRALAADEAAALAAADAAWARRAEGARGGTASEAAAEAAVTAARGAVGAEPKSYAARWRLMRALYFKGEHATAGNDAKKTVFDEGKRLGEETLDLLRREAGTATGKDLPKATPVELVPFVKGRPDVTACFLWSGVNWGKWALAYGKTAAARQGAAAKIRDLATAVVRLDPSFEDGGGYRVLGRLHHQTPSIPFVTGWASRTEALENLRLAVKVAPANFVNRLYLAEATWDYEKDRRAEARKALETLVADTPTAAFAVEDARAQEDARTLLAAWAKD